MFAPDYGSYCATSSRSTHCGERKLLASSSRWRRMTSVTEPQKGGKKSSLNGPHEDASRQEEKRQLAGSNKAVLREMSNLQLKGH